MEFVALLHKDQTSDYGVSFPDFPGCITAASNWDEARRMAVEALSLHIAGMQEDSEAIPRPSTLAELWREPAIKDAVTFLVNVKG
jgi:predicted RNase H-like HicB family nuclease